MPNSQAVDGPSVAEQRKPNLIPTTVFTGFLGSGKTTVIKNLIEHLVDQGQKVAYVKNEIGLEDFDTQLIKGQHIETKELLNGCICCTLVGPFMAAIDELAELHHFDRIIIETAGTADPASMALSVSNHPRLLRDGVITIIDVVNFDGYEDLSTVAKRQAEMTDLVVFNKVELVDLARKQTVVGYVRELNETAPIVEAPEGRLNPAVAFGLTPLDTVQLVAAEHQPEAHTDEPHHHNEHSTPHTHHHESSDGISAFTFVSSAQFDRSKFESILARLPKVVIRVKGVILFQEGWYVLNSVYRRFDLQPLNQDQFPTTPTQTRLIVIGYRVSDDVRGLSQLFQAAQLPDAAGASRQPEQS